MVYEGNKVSRLTVNQVLAGAGPVVHPKGMMAPCDCVLPHNKSLKPNRAVDEGSNHHMHLCQSGQLELTLNQSEKSFVGSNPTRCTWKECTGLGPVLNELNHDIRSFSCPC